MIDIVQELRQQISELRRDLDAANERIEELIAQQGIVGSGDIGTHREKIRWQDMAPWYARPNDPWVHMVALKDEQVGTGDAGRWRR